MIRSTGPLYVFMLSAFAQWFHIAFGAKLYSFVK